MILPVACTSSNHFSESKEIREDESGSEVQGGAAEREDPIVVLVTVLGQKSLVSSGGATPAPRFHHIVPNCISSGAASTAY